MPYRQSVMRNYLGKRARTAYVPRPVRRGARTLRYASPGVLPSRVHTFKRMGKIITLQSNGTAAPKINGVLSDLGASIAGFGAGDVIGTTKFGLGINFQLNNIASVTDITNLFDNYRIKYVKLRFDYSYNTAPGSTVLGGSQSVPRLHYTPDLDDASPPTAQGDVLENGWAKTGRLDKTLYCVIKPRFQSGVSVSGGTAVAGGIGPSAMWLDCQSPSIQHYGFKAYFIDMPEGGATATQYQWTVTITPTYVIEAKNTV